jgi:hypothetical protein
MHECHTYSMRKKVLYALISCRPWQHLCAFKTAQLS